MNTKISLKCNSRDEKMLMLALCSCFLPYYITVVGMLGLFCYIIFAKGRLIGALKGVANLFLCIFTIVTIYTALVYDNWIGMVVSFIFFGLVLVLNFASNICDKEFYIKLLLMLTRMSVVLSFASFAETAVFSSMVKIFRSDAYCMNPNYLADILMLSILTCAYLEMSKRANSFYCYTVAVINCVALYLTGSMSTWIALLIGFSVMLLVMRHHVTLGVLFMLAAVAVLILINSPELFPRLNEAAPTITIRFDIIDKVVKQIKQNPLFGQGFLTCWNAGLRCGYDNYRLWHAHNIIMECLVSFGIIGTALIGSTFLMIFRRLGAAHERVKESFGISGFVIAIVIAELAHSMVDLTILWVQTGLLAAILIGGGLGSGLKTAKE